jgi:hypothetical protein
MVLVVLSDKDALAKLLTFRGGGLARTLEQVISSDYQPDAIQTYQWLPLFPNA